MSEGFKQFLLFAGSSYYAEGGWADFKGSYDTMAEANAGVSDWLKKAGVPSGNVEDMEFDWFHIIDVRHGRIVASRQGEYCGQLETD